MSDRLLVLGATSLIGAHLAPALGVEGLGSEGMGVEGMGVEGRGATALSRQPPDTAAPAGLTWLQADLTAPDLAARLPPIGAVLSLSPIWLLPPALPALLAAGAERVVAVSSTSRFTKAASPIAAERATAARLAQAEAEVARLCDAAGAAWTVLRPTMIYSEGRDANVTRLARLIARFGVLPLSGDGAGLRQPVHAADLAAAAARVLNTRAAFARSYDLPGGETLTYRAMVERIFAALGRPPRILAVPPAVWSLGLKLASPLLPGATAAMGARMAADLTFDSTPAQRDFAWAPRPFRPVFAGRLQA